MSNKQQRPDPAIPGDVLPNLVLPNGAGAGVGMAQQSRAGHWQLLAFLEPDMLAERSDALAAARTRLDKVEALLHVVMFSEPNVTIAGVDLFDQSKGAAEFLLGEGKPGIAAISPAGQLAAVFGPDDIDKAVDYCEMAFKESNAETLAMAAPVLIIPDVFSADLCDRMIDFWKATPQKLENETSSRDNGQTYVDPGMKRRSDVLIPDGELFSEIRRSFTRRVLPMIDRAFRMQVASMEAPRIGCYAAEAEGRFAAHRDNTTQFTAHRRFAMSANLNTGDYEGGELRFPEFGRTLYAPPRGAAAIFSCSLLHEALPVTKGERFGMFTFFTDTAGLEQEKKAAKQREQQQQAAPAPVPQS